MYFSFFFLSFFLVSFVSFQRPPIYTMIRTHINNLFFKGHKYIHIYTAFSHIHTPKHTLTLSDTVSQSYTFKHIYLLKQSLTDTFTNFFLLFHLVILAFSHCHTYTQPMTDKGLYTHTFPIAHSLSNTHIFSLTQSSSHTSYPSLPLTKHTLPDILFSSHTHKAPRNSSLFNIHFLYSSHSLSLSRTINQNSPFYVHSLFHSHSHTRSHFRILFIFSHTIHNR
ncbi:unnamed protein product [Acanthosepion pharaonis]|uniref:Uncharacterized protein n=1 Tax=Acanthosepion pharaonis TaxID=158019 RepID=A0A812CGS2_ACAPH|nr:unnamed protein product [Sepia pharaonis]